MSEYPNGDTPRTGHEHSRYPMRGLGPIRNLAAEQREVVIEQLSTVTHDWCRHVIAGVKKNERNAMNQWAAAMRINGAEVEINVNLATMQAFGLPASEVQEIIERERQSTAASLEQVERDGIESLKWVMQQAPERRAEILSALGGQVVRQTEANGHG